MSNAHSARVGKRKKFNLLDVLIILFIVAVIAGVAFFLGAFSRDGDTVKVTFTVELRGIKDFFADIPQIGDEVYESIKDLYLGKIVEISFKPTVVYQWSHPEDMLTEQIVPDERDMYITIETEGYEDNATIKTKADDLELRVGKGIFIKGKGYASTGYITALETSGMKGD